jgi:branched-chain amino acid transport system substrate-binding protein
MQRIFNWCGNRNEKEVSKMKSGKDNKLNTLVTVTCIVALIFCATTVSLADSKRGITEETVKIGINCPLSRVLAHAGKATVDALQAYFRYVNEEKGGVHGRKIELVVRDHQYDPSRSLAEFKKLVTRDEVMALIGWGTPPTTILINPAMEEEVPMLCISGGTPLFNPPKKYILAMITPYRLQAAAVVSYIVETLGDKQPKIGLFYNNDDFGREGKAGVEMAAEHYGIEILSEAPHITGSPVDKAAVTKFKSAGVDYVLVSSHSGDVSSLLLEVKNQGLDADIYGVLAPASDRKIVQQAKEAAKRYYSVDAQGRWSDTKSPGIARMIELSRKYGSSDVLEAKSYYYILGWYPALLIVEALERAGKDLTVDKFLEALNTFKDWDTGGVVPPITVNAKRRVVALGGIICKTDLEKEDLLPVSGWIEPPAEITRRILGQ